MLLVAPANAGAHTPRSRVCVKVLTEPAMQDSLKKLGVETLPMTFCRNRGSKHG